MKRMMATLLPILLATSCAPAPPVDQAPTIAVSIAPVATMAAALCDGLAQVVTVVAPGESPATFDPSPRRMAALGDIGLYFACGVPLENQLLPRLRNSHPHLEIVDTVAGLSRLPLDPDSEDPHGHGELDPHLWLDPDLMAAQIKVMADHLAVEFPDRAELVRARADSLTAALADLDRQIEEELAPLRGRDLFVFHPAFGYFARAYGLRQVAIEQGGLDPSPRHLARVLESIKAAGARAVFAQPQFSLGSARAVARETGIRVVVLDPLAADYMDNMLTMAHAIREALDDGS